MKPYLLMVGYDYYASHGTGDWKGCYESKEKAEAQVKHDYNNRIVMVDDEYEFPTTYDWYQIVDLREWIN